MTNSDWPVQYPDPPVEVNHVYQLPRWVKALLLLTAFITLANGVVLFAVELQFQGRTSQLAHDAAVVTYHQCLERRHNAELAVKIYSDAVPRIQPGTDPVVRDILNGALTASQNAAKVLCTPPPS